MGAPRFWSRRAALRALLCLALIAAASAIAPPATAQLRADPPPGGAASGPPLLLKAFATAETPAHLSSGSLFARAGQLLFFTAGTAALLSAPIQTELWRSDGTAAGTVRLLSLPVGDPQAFITQLTAVGPTLYFTIVQSPAGATLWRSDGTAAGTAPVKTVPAGVSNLTSAGDTLFFFSDQQLWKSDGTAAGTLPVGAPRLTAGVSEIVAAGGSVFYATFLDGLPRELWRSDGTPAGTIRLGTFDPVSCFRFGCSPETLARLVAVGSTLFFLGKAGSAQGLWRSDGTQAGTQLLSPLPPDTLSIDEIEPVGGQVFFTTHTGAFYDGTSELWRSDGTAAGTVRLRQLGPAAGLGTPFGLAGANGLLFFRTSWYVNGAHDLQLWRSDGTPGGTLPVTELPELIRSTDPGLTPVFGMVLFEAGNAATGAELWESDGTAGGTRLVAELTPGPAGAELAGLTVVGPRLFFVAKAGEGELGLWALPLDSQPYRRAPVRVRTTIPAAAYDLGGEGLAYHDLDPFNRRGVFRTDEGVDIAADPAGGYVVGWVHAGEWLNYQVDIAHTATYTLEVEVASYGPGGTFHVLVDGVDRTGSLRVPDTGSWERWETLRTPGLELSAGAHSLRLVMEADGAEYVGNFKALTLDAARARVYLPLTRR